MDDAVLADVLDDVARRLAAHGVDWALGGSASRRLRGAAVAPNDVDVVVRADARDVVVEALPGAVVADGPRPEEWRSDWLVRWRHPTGVVVEVIGGAVVMVGGAREALPPDRAVELAWRGRSLAVSAPEVWDRLAPGWTRVDG